MLDILAVLAIYELIFVGSILCGFFIFLIIIKTAYKISFKEAYAFLNEGIKPNKKQYKRKRKRKRTN